ncbi:uncharacterized protein [Temnothorax longispinosus]|uniref:uncharacterized protein n=1 Tax=Temnothorax longispinosus TaxID=300112 RepID=UPI003A98E60C
MDAEDAKIINKQIQILNNQQQTLQHAAKNQLKIINSTIGHMEKLEQTLSHNENLLANVTRKMQDQFIQFREEINEQLLMITAILADLTTDINDITDNLTYARQHTDVPSLWCALAACGGVALPALSACPGAIFCSSSVPLTVSAQLLHGTKNLRNDVHRIDSYRDSKSDTSSDEEWELLKKKRKRNLRPHIQNVELVIELYSNYEFKSHFRLERATFEYILSIISDYLVQKTRGNETIPSRKQLMIALWKIATMDSYRSICDRFDVGRATALKAVRRVTRALFKVADQFISWLSGEEAQTVMRKFKENSRFSNVIGAIDGTHIRIEAPTQNAADYVNRKGCHSLQLQVYLKH